MRAYSPARVELKQRAILAKEHELKKFAVAELGLSEQEFVELQRSAYDQVRSDQIRSDQIPSGLTVACNSQAFGAPGEYAGSQTAKKSIDFKAALAMCQEESSRPLEAVLGKSFWQSSDSQEATGADWQSRSQAASPNSCTPRKQEELIEIENLEPNESPHNSPLAQGQQSCELADEEDQGLKISKRRSTIAVIRLN